MYRSDLEYDIVKGDLIGSIPKYGKVEIRGCWSGGRGGAIKDGKLNEKVWDKCLVNNPIYSIWKKGSRKYGQIGIGGPLPAGYYTVTPHKTTAFKLVLTPMSGTKMFGRSAMQIHGRGERGSDGCIVVPQNKFSELRNIYQFLLDNSFMEYSDYVTNWQQRKNFNLNNIIPTLRVVEGLMTNHHKNCSPFKNSFFESLLT